MSDVKVKNEATHKSLVGSNTITHVFDSTVDAMRRIEDAPQVSEAMRSSRKRPDHDWDLGAGWKRSVEMGRLGWADPADDVRSKAAEVRHEAQAIVDAYKVEPLFGFTGSMVDMSRLMAGDPEHMIDWPMLPDPSAGKVVRILIGAAASCAIEAEDMMARGVAVVALAECILATGRNVEIWVEGTHLGEGKKRVSWLTKIKGADHSIEVENLLAWIAHPMAFRRLGFGLIERMGEHGESWLRSGYAFGYGSAATTNYAARVESMVEAIGDKVDVDIPPPGHSLHNRPEVVDPIKWIESTLAKLAG